ncbi:hypothetical protein L3X38_026867 [Prunus dulcis]|uniref:Uncharacterized protein n=1 Tax=Prunus dulcis TaxID=3755 RepID=A0AAD4YZQ9_PRUDU|nr:hypothetical protein L3X38_026867 [Prunus dulcis]
MECAATRESLSYAVKLGLRVFRIWRNINKQLRHKNLLLKAMKPSPLAKSLVETFDTPTSGQIIDIVMAGSSRDSRGENGQEGVPNNIQDFFRMKTSLGNTMQRGIGGSNKVVEQFRKNLPLVFEGEGDPLAAEEWISELKSIFTYIDCPVAQKVTCVTFMLKKGARH